MTGALARAYAGKRVLVTGHTGFKGSWMSVWLHAMGAEVHGLSLPAPTDPAMFEVAGVEPLLAHTIGDIRDKDTVYACVDRVQPDLIFHMAAQPIVRESYATPLETLDANVMGTAHVLEAARRLTKPCAVVVITSDKCYDNREWVWGYRETDPMGGHDPYSMSKGAAELVTQSWRRSYFSGADSNIRLASGRAGNVIGGGDWAADRILTDCIAALTSNHSIKVRNPLATRPWQHVLEPLSGYLWLGAQLAGEDGQRFAEGWNFGPHVESVRPVRDLADLVIAHWGTGSWDAPEDPTQVKEALSLALNCDKAAHRLHWLPAWSLEQCIARTVDWYKAWHRREADMLALTREQIALYEADARAKGIAWAL